MTSPSSAPKNSVEHLNVSEIIRNQIDTIDFSQIDINDDQIDASIERVFKNIRQTLQKLGESVKNSIDTKENIFNAIDTATGQNKDINKWLCLNMGIDYEKLKTNPDQFLTEYDLVQKDSEAETKTNPEEPSEIYHTVSRVVFKEKKNEALRKVESWKSVLKDVYSKALAAEGETLPPQLSEESVVDEALKIFYSTLKKEYIQKGFFPKYDVVPALLSASLFETIGLFQKTWGSIMNTFGKGVDYEKLHLSIRENITSELRVASFQREFEMSENILKDGYKPGKYAKIQNGENLLDNLYGGREPEDLTVEELAYQIEYEKKQVELLESLDEYESEKIREEYKKGVITGTIGVPFDVWYAYNKKPHLTGTEKTFHTLKKIAKPFLKLWTIAQNFWDKLFGDEDMEWSDVLNTKKKDGNEYYTAAKERLESLQNAEKRVGLLASCTERARSVNPSHVSGLSGLSYEQLQQYDQILTRNTLEVNGSQQASDSLMGNALMSLNKVENVLMVHEWQSGGFASLKNEQIFLNGQMVPFTDSAVEQNKSFLLLDPALYLHWPEKVPLAYTKANGSLKDIKVWDESLRAGVNKLSSDQVTVLYSALKSSVVQNFLNVLNTSSIGKTIQGTNADYRTEKCLSIEFLELLAGSDIAFQKIEEAPEEGWGERTSGFISGILSRGDSPQEKDFRFVAQTSLGDLPFNHFGDLKQQLSQ